jgi:hypothetical protein
MFPTFLPFSGLCFEALSIADFTASNGWRDELDLEDVDCGPAGVLPHVCLKILRKPHKTPVMILTRVRVVTIDGGSDLMIGFIDTLHTPLRTTINYGATADLHTSQFTVTYKLGISVFTSRILATDFNTVIIPVSL